MGTNATQDVRKDWVDIARGIGIILVVYGHALRGHFPLPHRPSWASSQDAIIYSFHMPLFFVLAGLFSGPRSRRAAYPISRADGGASFIHISYGLLFVG